MLSSGHDAGVQCMMLGFRARLRIFEETGHLSSSCLGFLLNLLFCFNIDKFSYSIVVYNMNLIKLSMCGDDVTCLKRRSGFSCIPVIGPTTWLKLPRPLST